MRLRSFAATLFIAPLGASIHAGAAEPFFEKTFLFEAGQAGVALYRIPGIVATRKGTVLAYCEARKNDKADWGEIEVHLRRSTDGGKTWDPVRKIAHMGPRIEGNPKKPAGGEHEQTVNNPVAIVEEKAGLIHFLYCLNYARCFYMRSTNDGVTFSEPVEITAAFEGFRKQWPWKVLATGPGHGVQMQSGRLVVAVWLANGKNPGDHGPASAGTIYSDDSGRTWHAGDIAVPHGTEFNSPNETTLAPLPDGGLMLNTRSISPRNRRLVTTSPDGAGRWSHPRYDAALWEPVCMGSLLALPSAEHPETLLFANPHSVEFDAQGKELPSGRGKRKNLSVKLSRDAGKTWPFMRPLEPGKSAYSDMAALLDGTVLMFYERDDRLALARFNAEWVIQGGEAP